MRKPGIYAFPKSVEFRMTDHKHTSAPDWRGARTHVWLGLGFGMLTGLIEVAAIAFKTATHTLPLFSFSAHYPIAAPLANLVLFGAVGLLFSVLTLLFRNSLPETSVVLVMSYGLWYVVLLHLSSILGLALHHVAVLVLALGLSFQTMRWVAGRQAFFAMWGKRSCTACLGMYVLLVTGCLWGTGVTPQRLQSGSPDAGTDSRRNVILVVLDTVRARSLSMYGYERETTPNLARLAEQGVLFENAIAPAPWTLPTHASMFTGLPPHQTGADWSTPLNPELPTIAESLTANGYQTAAFIGNIYYCGRQTGLERGFSHFSGARLLSVDLFRHSTIAWRLLNAAGDSCGCSDTIGRRTALEINREYEQWRNTSYRDAPRFAFLNYYDAHSPYLPRQPFRQTYGPRNQDQAELLSDWSNVSHHPNVNDETIELGRNAYDGCLAALDAELGWLFEELEASGDLEDTILIVTSDHGEQFGEQGLLSHARTVHRSSTRVPLLVVAPGLAPAGQRVRDVVSLCDLPATILDMTRVNAPEFPGRSLARFWSAEGDSTSDQAGDDRIVLSEVTRGIAVPSWQPNAFAPVRSVWVDDVQYIRWGRDGEFEEAYDFFEDPLEEHNLVQLDELDPRVEKCRAAFEQVYGSQAD